MSTRRPSKDASRRALRLGRAYCLGYNSAFGVEMIALAIERAVRAERRACLKAVEAIKPKWFVSGGRPDREGWAIPRTETVKAIRDRGPIA